MTPRVTVLMTVYNGLPYLSSAIESVLQQTFSDFELLLVDDASKDGSIDRIRSYSDPRIRILLNEHNHGQAYSLNRGLAIARGDYVARFDQDDLCLPTRLQEQVAFLDAQPDIACVGTWHFLMDPGGRKTGLETGVGELRENDFGTFLGILLTQATPIGHPTVMFRRDLICALDGYDETFSPCEDYELWCRLGIRRYRVGVIPKPLVMVRLHAGQQSAKALPLQQTQCRRAHDRLIATFCPNEHLEEVGSLLRMGEDFGQQNSSWRAVWRELMALRNMLRNIRTRLQLSTREMACLKQRVYGWLGRGAFLAIIEKRRQSLLVWLEASRASSWNFASGAILAYPLAFVLSPLFIPPVRHLLKLYLNGLGKKQRTVCEGEVSRERLAEVLDQLKQVCPDIPLLAIPWMEARHPIHPVQEELLGVGGQTRQSRGWQGFLVKVGRLGVSLLYAMVMMVRIVGLRYRLRREIALLRDQSFALIAKTWHLGGNPINGDGVPDFYYGDLQERLEDRGLKMLLILGDPRGLNWRSFPRAGFAKASSWRLPEMCLVPPSAPFQMLYQQVQTSLQLARVAARTNDPLVKRVAERASSDCLSHEIAPMGLYYWIGRQAVRWWHPRAFLTLYEGHGWEQSVWKGVKAADPTCKTVGYQHTILMQHNIALLRPRLGGGFSSRPDVVLCLGHRTQEMLESSHLRSTNFVPFGSFRRPAKFGLNHQPSPHKRAVLVLPEGYLDETVLLFNAAIQVASCMPDYRFLLRCHPVLPYNVLDRKLERDSRRLPNVEVCLGRPIEEDFRRASVIFYRGTSSVLYAILQGLKPIYLQDSQYHEVDPLFELRDWKERVSSIGELERVLHRYAQEDSQQVLPAWQRAVEYVNSYALTVDESSIDRFLAGIGLGQSLREAESFGEPRG